VTVNTFAVGEHVDVAGTSEQGFQAVSALPLRRPTTVNLTVALRSRGSPPRRACIKTRSRAWARPGDDQNLNRLVDPSATCWVLTRSAWPQAAWY
jgi:hypothetical protein